MKNTIVIYKLGGTTYSHIFTGRVLRSTVETYLIMQKHIGRSQIGNAIVSISNLA